MDPKPGKIKARRASWEGSGVAPCIAHRVLALDDLLGALIMSWMTVPKLRKPTMKDDEGRWGRWRMTGFLLALFFGGCTQNTSQEPPIIPTYKDCPADLNLDGVVNAEDRNAWTDYSDLVLANPEADLVYLYQRRLNIDRSLGHDDFPDRPDSVDLEILDMLIPDATPVGENLCVELIPNEQTGKTMDVRALLDDFEAMFEQRRGFLLDQQHTYRNNLGDFTQAVAAILYDDEIVGVLKWNEDPSAETALHTLFWMGSSFKPITALSTLKLMDDESEYLNNDVGAGLDTPIDFQSDLGLQESPRWKHWRAYEYGTCHLEHTESWQLCDGDCPDPTAVTPRALLRHRSGLARDAGAHTRPPSDTLRSKQTVQLGSQFTQIPLLGGDKYVWGWDDPNAWDPNTVNNTWSGGYPTYTHSGPTPQAGTWKDAGTYTPKWADIRSYYADSQTLLFWYPHVTAVGQSWNYSNLGYSVLAGMIDKFLYEKDLADPDVEIGEERRFDDYVRAQFGPRSVGMDTFTMQPDWAIVDPAYRVRNGHFAPWLQLYAGVSNYQTGEVDSGRWQSVYGRGAGGSSWASVMDMANLVKSLMRAGTSGGLPRHNDDLQTTLGDAHPANNFDVLRGTGPQGAPLLESTLQFDLGADGVCVDSTTMEVCDPNDTPTWLTSTGGDSEYPVGTNYFTGTLFVGKNAHARQFWHHGGGGPGLTAFLIYSPATATERSVGVVVAGNNRNTGLPGMAAHILRKITEADPPTSYPGMPGPGGWVADEAASVLNEGPAYAGGSRVCH
jgi:hypothetical protein